MAERRDTLKKVIGVALPTMFENFMISLVNIVDVAMVGSLGAEATAAAALNAQPAWFANSVSMLVAGGVTVLVARCWGAEDRPLAGVYARHAVVLACLLGAILTCIAQFAAGTYAGWMNAAPNVAPNAVAYMHIVGGVMIPFVLSRALAGALQGTGDTVTPMKISLCANFCNVVGNFLLIYPARRLTIFGMTFPMWGAGMGVRGAAIATAASFVISASLLIVVLARRRDGLRLSPNVFSRFKVSRARDMLSVGAPISAERVTISIGQMFYMSVISSLGTISISSHFIAQTAESVCYNPAFGVAVAATALTGQALGAGDEAQAERVGRECVYFCATIMTVVSICMYFGADWMIAFFTEDPGVRTEGARMLRIVAWSETVFGVVLATSGVLRGAGDTMISLWLGIFCMYVVRLLLARLFVMHMGWGLAGAWHAMNIDIFLRGAFLWMYFLSGRWKRRSRKLAERMKS